MTWSQRKLRFVAKTLLLLLVGTQACLAFNAGFLFAPPIEISVASETAASPSCHSESQANADSSRSVCRLHCAIDAQYLDQHETFSLPPCLKGPPILPLQAMPVQMHIPRGSWHDAHSTDPPISIRFCSFLI